MLNPAEEDVEQGKAKDPKAAAGKGAEGNYVSTGRLMSLGKYKHLEQLLLLICRLQSSPNGAYSAWRWWRWSSAQPAS